MHLEREKKWIQAIRELEKAIEISPGYGEAYYELAKLYRQQGASAQASVALQQAIQADANCAFYEGDVDLLFSLVGDKGFYLDVLSAYQRAVALNPDSAELHYNLGRVLAVESYNMANLERAIAEYQRAISLRSDYSEAYVALGNAYLDLGRPEHALPAFQRATGMKWSEKESPFSLYPGSPSRSAAYLGLAKAHIKLGQFDQANTVTQIAIEISPEEGFSILCELADAYQDQGKAFIDQNRFDLAAAAFLQAVTVYSMIQVDSPGSAYAYFGLAISYYRLGLQSLDSGDRDEAAHLLDSALKAWEAGYATLADPEGRSEKVWRDARSMIESTRKRAKSKWRLW